MLVCHSGVAMISHVPTHPQSRRLRLTAHARRRLTERGLWPALGAIALIAHHDTKHRYDDRAKDGRRVLRIETPDFVIIVAGDAAALTLVTAHAKTETGARGCARFTAAAADLRRKVSA